MGSTGKQEESAGREDLQAVGTAATPPYKSKGGRPGAAPAVPREGNNWQTKGQQPGRGAGVSRKVVVGRRGGEGCSQYCEGGAANKASKKNN